MKKNIYFLTKDNFEKTAWNSSSYVCGIDEAGRGSLCGPLVVAAVILPQNLYNKELKDSKKILPKKRELLFQWIIKHCYTSIIFVDSCDIDKFNIYESTLYAMKKSFIQIIEIIPFSFSLIKYVIVDSMPLTLKSPFKHKKLEIHNPNYGESISSTVAAASIIAKVTRDRIMNQLSCSFPRFSFKTDKGYGTKNHIKIINKTGISLIHRLSFCLKNKKKENREQQQLFFHPFTKQLQ